MKILTVSCIGLGLRGDVYLSLMKSMPDKYKIVSLCDRNEIRLSNFSNKFVIEKSGLFLDDKEFFKEKRSDVLLICTQDKDHVGNVLDALKCGYKKILVEKPFATSFDDIEKVEVEAKKANAQILICHVLRYAPAYLKAKEYIDEGKIGVLKSIDASEKVGLLHQAHSYVRGNYGVKEKSSPMIMAKCCHDLDLLVWYSNSLCQSISSIGSLTYFVKENKPEGSSDRCYNCKFRNSCHYDAETLYKTHLSWARESVCDVRPVTDEALRECLKTNKFGRCVFGCDNNVVDNQIVMMKFANGVEASLKMTAFSPFGGRIYWFYGTEGEIKIDEQEGVFLFRDKTGKTEITPVSKLINAKEGHGGGDKGLINSLYQIFTGEKLSQESSLEYSIESHKMSLFAEESRLNNGVLINMKIK